ncbi:MAG TPA: RNA polymerase sigma factor [Pseudonocardiaceae bacterium]|nr:RNA polymerase sigma factor [Pseudonocardiaceae bacterium]
MTTVSKSTAGPAPERKSPAPGPDAESDKALWARSAAGDHGAFAELFERHVQAVWNHLYRVTGSWSLAEDLTANTFLVAWRKHTELTLVRDSALPWLYTVASNLAHTELRKHHRFARLLRTLPTTDVTDDHAGAVTDAIAARQELRVVLDAVRRLPRAQRRTVELCLLSGLSTADAAATLGVSEVSVRAELSRARKRLRGMVKEDQS